MNRDGIRIEKIKSDNAELLRKVRESIINNHDNLNESIKDAITVIDFDEKCIKKQEAMNNAQELIASLTKEIVEAKTKEEVFEIRKRLNYYINKIKEEIKNRDVEESKLNDYQVKVTYLRKDIAKYIRFLKREDNIAEIDRLYSNYENLSKDEMTTLKKSLTKEVNYNRRNLKEPKPVVKKNRLEDQVIESYVRQTNEPSKINKNDSCSLEEQVVESYGQEPLYPYVQIKSGLQEKKPEETKFQLKEVPRELRRPGSECYTKNMDFADVEKYLSGRVLDYNRQYSIYITEDYGRKGLGKNIKNFFKNLPLYIHNKKAIKNMTEDYYRYYNGNDLGSYIEYLKRRNSIKHGLKCIFSKTHLYSNTNLIQHEKCTMWLYEFCNRHGMSITFQKTM